MTTCKNCHRLLPIPIKRNGWYRITHFRVINRNYEEIDEWYCSKECLKVRVF